MVKAVMKPSSDEVMGHLKNVRNDKTPETWALLKQTTQDPSAVEFFKTGTGAYSELSQHISDDCVYYALLRVDEIIEETCNTVKFVGINFVGSKMSFVSKGRLGIYNGDIMDNIISPIAIDFQGISDISELSDAMIMDKVGQTSNTANRILENTQGRVERSFTDTYYASSKLPSSTNTGSTGSSICKSSSNNGSLPIHVTKTATSTLGGAKKTHAAATFEARTESGLDVAQELIVEINHVRSDAHPSNWVVAAFADNDCKKQMIVQKTGSDGFSGLIKELQDESKVNFVFWRTKDVFDGYETVKFIYISKVSHQVKPLQKAKLTTLVGGLRAFFEPYHIKIDADNVNEISEKSIMDEVTKASGSKNWTM